MIKIVKQGINPILDQNGYPEMSFRIGIDVGDQNRHLGQTGLYGLKNLFKICLRIE